MKGVQANQAAQVRMFAHDAIPVAIGAINPEFGITIDSGGYGYAVGNTIVLNTPSGGAAAQLKVKSIGSSSIINDQANGGKFYLDGAQAPAITLNRGKTYTFYQKATSNATHVLAFSSTDPAGGGGASAYISQMGGSGGGGDFSNPGVFPGSPGLVTQGNAGGDGSTQAGGGGGGAAAAVAEEKR